jgi:pimeloyl-ACP methyl ester carboxylesterase
MACPGPAQGASRRLSYWQWGAPDAAHAVVCVHGLTRQGRDFDVLAQALLAAADGPLRVICPDMAGRGASDRLSDPHLYQVPTYVADSLQLLAHLHREAPLTVLDWVGTSMGGLIGMVLCGTPDLPLPLPVPVRRLVINDIGPTMDWQALQRIGAYVGQAGRFETEEQAAQVLAQLSVGFGPHTPEQWMALSRPMLRALPEGGYTLHYDPAIGLPFRAVTEEDARKGEAALWQAWDHITAQTLLLRGAQSDLLSTTTAQAMTQRGPRARLLEFPGVGHAPTLVSPQQHEPVIAFLLA